MSSTKTSQGTKQPGFKSSDTSIEILVIIDTDKLQLNYSGGGSKDYNKPTPIDHSYEFMYCAGAPSSQAGTGDLTFQAKPGDFVSFFGTSFYGNADVAVIVYGIQPIDGQPNVFNNFDVEQIVRQGAAQPDPNAPSRNGMPAIHGPITFSTLASRVKQAGTEKFWIQFAVYTLADGETQQLFGYFAWDPTIIVK